MNKTARYFKLNWKNGGYVVIKRYGIARIHKGIPKFAKKNGENTVFGYLIYGSKREYDGALTHYFYNDVDSVEELTKEEVAKDHFIGLI